jgi:hypothetical protein
LSGFSLKVKTYDAPACIWSLVQNFGRINVSMATEEVKRPSVSVRPSYPVSPKRRTKYETKLLISLLHGGIQSKSISFPVLSLTRRQWQWVQFSINSVLQFNVCEIPKIGSAEYNFLPHSNCVLKVTEITFVYMWVWVQEPGDRKCKSTTNNLYALHPVVCSVYVRISDRQHNNE